MDGAGRAVEASSDFSELVQIVEATGSTNDDVLGLAAEGAPEGTAVCAKRQTTGRGRRGHSWVSPPGGLYITVLLRPRTDECVSSGLPAVTALAVLETLGGLGAEGLCLKWPNDLVLKKADGSLAKLGGILVESRQESGGAWHAAAGIGLNLVRPAQEKIVPSRVHDGMAKPLPAAYLEDAFADEVPDLLGEGFGALAISLDASIVSASRVWARKASPETGPLAPIRERFERKLAYIGDDVFAIDPAGMLLAEGRFSGIDSWGRAQIALGDGSVRIFLPEEASLRTCH